MSLHKSLRVQKWARRRTVRKRGERLKTLYAELLKKGGLSEAQIKVFGLPKEKGRTKIKKAPKKKEEEKKTELLPFTYGSTKV